ncbi:hypothetical protein [Psychrobacter alimentarius]|uniref:hypothetical protein n=1 Tax=Psychrobacter alimentarius TaxID=261164 RepID=UPI00191928CA|nr:hypothetical protein [Psychrobacter alimentarius]
MLKVIFVKKSESNMAIVYHAKRLSPIDALFYLSFFEDQLPYQASPSNSLEYDIAVIYCIFSDASSIGYRSQ